MDPAVLRYRFIPFFIFPYSFRNSQHKENEYLSKRNSFFSIIFLYRKVCYNLFAGIAYVKSRTKSNPIHGRLCK